MARNYTDTNVEFPKLLTRFKKIGGESDFDTIKKIVITYDGCKTDKQSVYDTDDVFMVSLVMVYKYYFLYEKDRHKLIEIFYECSAFLQGIKKYLVDNKAIDDKSSREYHICNMIWTLLVNATNSSKTFCEKFVDILPMETSKIFSYDEISCLFNICANCSSNDAKINSQMEYIEVENNNNNNRYFNMMNDVVGYFIEDKKIEEQTKSKLCDLFNKTRNSKNGIFETFTHTELKNLNVKLRFEESISQVDESKPSDMSQNNDSWDIFLSYSRKDKSQVDKIYKCLSEIYNVWYDDVNMIDSTDTDDAMVQGIKNSKIFICCLSPSYQIKKSNSMTEFIFAYKKLKNDQILPVKLDKSYKFDDIVELKLRNTHHLSLRNDNFENNDFNELLVKLSKLIRKI